MRSILPETYAHSNIRNEFSQRYLISGRGYVHKFLIAPVFQVIPLRSDSESVSELGFLDQLGQ